MVGPSNPFLEAVFSAACLYAATLIIFGMMSLHQTAFQRRKQILTRQYGHPIPEAKPENSIANNRYFAFAQHFFLRPQFVFGVLMGAVVIRNYEDPFTSCGTSILI